LCSGVVVDEDLMLHAGIGGGRHEAGNLHYSTYIIVELLMLTLYSTETL